MKLKKSIIFTSLLTSFSIPALTYAHGALSYPESRQWICSTGATPNKNTPWDGGSNSVCQSIAKDGQQSVMTDWSGVAQGGAAGKISKWGKTLDAHKKAVGSKGICSGGNSKYKALDDPKHNWQSQATLININDQSKPFTYAVSAPHRTYGEGYVDVYITKDGRQPNKILTFNDLDANPICHYKSVPGESPLQNGQNGDGSPNHFEDFECHIPSTVSQGYHALFVVWQRNDSDEAFYSCSDINVVNETPVAITWNKFSGEKDSAQIPSYEHTKENDKIIFEAVIGEEKLSTSIIITARNNHDWQYDFAKQISNLSNKIKVGMLNNNNKIMPQTSNNAVYIDAQYSSAKNTWKTEYIEAEKDPMSKEWEAIRAVGKDSHMLYDITALKSGDRITFRLFDDKDNLRTGISSGSSDLDKISLNITDSNILNWKYELAKEFNSKASSKEIVRIGILSNDEVIPSKGKGSSNGVYLLKSAKETSEVYSWIIDVKSEPQPTPDDKPKYPNGIGNYDVDTVVIAKNGVEYKCLNGGWCNQEAYDPLGVHGSATWQKMGADPEPVPEGNWESEKIYNFGDIVEIDSVKYHANHWTKNQHPINTNCDSGCPWSII